MSLIMAPQPLLDPEDAENPRQEFQEEFTEVDDFEAELVEEEDDPTTYAAVLSHAVKTFGSRTNANPWLNKPNRVFHNQSPLQILTEDPAAVEEELVRIDHGMFI